MKYIKTQTGSGVEEIFLFPDVVSHDCMAEVIRHIRDQTYGNWKRVPRDPVSAGLVDANGKCYGMSESLGLKSLGAKDTKLLKSQMSGQ